MAESLSINTKHFSKELRKFAFRGNADFKTGLVSSVEMSKVLWLPTDPIKTENGDTQLPFRRLTVNFRSDRESEDGEKYRPTYIYALSSVAERSINVIPDHVIEEIRAEEDSDTIELINSANPGDISESALVTFETSDVDLSDNEIQVAHSYEISVCDRPVYQRDDDEIFYSSAGEMVSIPKIESLEGAKKMLVKEHIPHEQIDQYERIHTEIAFRAIVEPFSREYDAIVGFDEAVQRMRVIMDILQNGLNVARLYDLR